MQLMVSQYISISTMLLSLFPSWKPHILMQVAKKYGKPMTLKLIKELLQDTNSNLW